MTPWPTGALALMSLSGGPEASDLILLGVMLVVVAALMVWRQRRRGAGRHLPAEPRRDPASRDMQRDLGELAGEIEQLAQRLGAEFEQRAARLEGLLRDADQKIAELRRLKGEPPARAGAGGTAGSATTDSGLPPASTFAGASADLSDTGLRGSGETGEGRGQARQGQPPAPSAAATAAREDAIARSVCELADAGHNSLEIARRLHEHVGKVELILALRQS